MAMNYRIYKLSGEQLVGETTINDACYAYLAAEGCARRLQRPVALVIDDDADDVETYICTDIARGDGFYNQESASYLHAMSLYDADSWDLIEHVYECDMLFADISERGARAAKARGKPVVIDYFGDQWLCKPSGRVKRCMTAQPVTAE